MNISLFTSAKLRIFYQSATTLSGYAFTPRSSKPNTIRKKDCQLTSFIPPNTASNPSATLAKVYNTNNPH